jgi:hypothetical protein
MSNQPNDLNDFLEKYNADGSHPETVIDVTPGLDRGASPFIIIRCGDKVAIVNPLGFDDHLCLDVHSFVADQDATAGVFGMTNGKQWALPKPAKGGPGTTSHGWSSTSLVAVLIGEQAGEEKGLAL